MFIKMFRIQNPTYQVMIFLLLLQQKSFIITIQNDKKVIAIYLSEYILHAISVRIHKYCEDGDKFL